MAKFDFSDILNRQHGSAPEPKPVPAGTYYGTIEGLPKPREINTKNGIRGILGVRVSLTEAGEDVDEAELAASGGLAMPNGKAKTVTADFWLDEDSLWAFEKFLDSMGFEKGTCSYTEANEQLPGRAVTVEVIVDEFEQNGVTRTNNKVKRIFAQD